MLVSASLVVAPGLSPPRRQVSPIPLIGGKDPVLSVAGWWVGVVHPVLHGSAGPFRPRLQGRDATESTYPMGSKIVVYYTLYRTFNKLAQLRKKNTVLL